MIDSFRQARSRGTHAILLLVAIILGVACSVAAVSSWIRMGSLVVLSPTRIDPRLSPRVATGDPDPEFDQVCGWVNKLGLDSPVRLHFDLRFRDPCLFNEDHEIPLACGDCASEYFRFAERIETWRLRRLDEGALAAQIRDPARAFGPLVTQPMSRDDLAAALDDALSISRLLGESLSSPINVTIVDQSVMDDVCSEVVVIDNPIVGKFAGWLLMPRNAARPTPAILAVHGHGGSPIAMFENASGAQFVERGFGLYMHAARAMCMNAREGEISRSLLLDGASLIALQVYEHLIVTRMLDGFEAIGRVGTYGHSGGAVSTNLSAIIDPLIEAHVYDSYSTYVDHLPDGSFSHAMAPAIWRFHPVINGNYEPGQPPVPRDAPPRFRVAYDPSPDDISSVADFFDDHLRGER